MRKTEHDEHCRSIADRLEKAANGELYRDGNGNEWEWYDQDDDGTIIVCTYEYHHYGDKLEKTIISAYSNDDGETWTRGDNGEAIELEQMSVYDAIGDVYNVEYRTHGRDCDPDSVQLMIACGGPNIYIDTKSGDVELYWWGEEGRYPMAREVIDELNDMARELWHC